MKKLIVLFLMFLTCLNVVFADDKYSKDYLQNNRHFSIVKPFAESFVEHSTKAALKRETNGQFRVKYKGYTVASMKQGIFKYLKITGKNVTTKEVMIPYVYLETLTDYNYIDYQKSPIEFKSDMTFKYEVLLSEDSINTALKHKQYNEVLKKLNDIAYPMFEIKGVNVKLLNNKLYILTEYNFPLAPTKRDKVFVSTADFVVEEGTIIAKNVKLNSAYGNVSLRKVANLLNLLNPLEYTMTFLSSKQCKANVENVKIVDNNVQINGKINIKGE